ARLPDTRPRRGAKSVLQPCAGYRGCPADSTLDDLVSRSGPVALLLSRAGAGCALLHGRTALGHRAVQSRGSALPRSRTTRGAVMAAPALAGKGMFPQCRPGLLLFYVDCPVTLAQFRRRRPCLVDCAHGCRVPGLCHGSAALHGLASDNEAVPGSGPALTAL